MVSLLPSRVVTSKGTEFALGRGFCDEHLTASGAYNFLRVGDRFQISVFIPPSVSAFVGAEELFPMRLCRWDFRTAAKTRVIRWISSVIGFYSIELFTEQFCRFVIGKATPLIVFYFFNVAHCLPPSEGGEIEVPSLVGQFEGKSLGFFQKK